MSRKLMNIIITVVLVVASFTAAAFIIAAPFFDDDVPGRSAITMGQSESNIIQKGSTDIGSAPTILKVEGNRITNAVNGNILLKGLMPPDLLVLHDQGRLDKDFFVKIKNTRANVIRIPVHPNLWIKDPDYLENYVVPAVSWANELGMYAIIDLHYIGNIVTGAGNEMPKIDNNPKELSEDFWAKTARRFKDSPNVIFEICNEPTAIDAKQWSDFAGKLVELIREQGAEQLVIVGGIQYSQDLSWVKKTPILDDNIAYAAHIYPAHDRSNWEGWFGWLAATRPVIVTEWGFIDENRNETEQHYLVGDKTSYGIPFLNYLEEKNIGWVACWFDDTWEPEIFTKNENGLTNYGQFVMQQLKEAGK